MGYTFVEKLQTIATTYRQEQNGKEARPNLMRQYYDIYCLLANKDVNDFIGTDACNEHKRVRFPKADLDIPISENEAFLLSGPDQRNAFRKRYIGTASPYYKGQPDFEDLLTRIKEHIDKL